MFKVIKEIFENPVLDNFYETRSKGLLSVILKENNFDNSNIQDDLLNTIEQLASNNEVKKQLLERVKNYWWDKKYTAKQCIWYARRDSNPRSASS